MLIHCTKRACERMKISPPIAQAVHNPLYSWRLNVVEDGRKRLVVFMNDASRYCIVLVGIKAKDWPKLPGLFIERFREVMIAEQINPDIIDRYIVEAGSAQYYKNSDKQMTSWINKACDAACLGYYNHNNDIDISLFACRYMVGTKSEKDYWVPSDRFHAALLEYGLPLKRCRAYELDVRLKTNSDWVCRRLIVPSEITFEQLANVIKRAYGWWKRENQFHFLLYTDNGLPALYLREELDPSSYDLPVIVMTGIKLSEYIPKYKAMRFLYDYRANWTLLINLTTEYDNYIGAIPQLEFGEGNAPPEEVGGAKGFEAFLDKLENGKYAERKEAAQWGVSYGYAEFDFEKTNRDVESSLIW